MTDLERVMQINRSSMYQTYGSKHELFLKSLKNYIQKVYEQYSHAAQESEDPLQSIKNVVNSVVNAAIKDANCLFTKSIFELALTDQAVSKLLENHALKVVSFFENLLVSAQNNGSISPDKDPRVLAHFIVSGLASINYNQIVFKDKLLTRHTADVLIASIAM